MPASSTKMVSTLILPCLMVIGSKELLLDLPAATANGPAVSSAWDLVRQLGDRRFAVRRDATDELIELGMPAIAPLQQGTNHPDREIRYRSQRIISIIRRLDFHRRLESFASGRDAGNDLPGWQRFVDLVGVDADARALFVKMQKEETQSMEATGKHPLVVADVLDARCQDLQRSLRVYRKPLAVENIAAMIFLATEVDVTLTPQTTSAINSFCFQPSFRDAMQEGSNRAAMRRLLGAWIRRGDGWMAYQGLSLAMQFDLSEGLVPAEKILGNSRNPAHIRQYAILTIAKLGGDKHIPLLEALLTDDTRTALRRLQTVSYETQIRDVALASLIYLTEQDHRQFGFTRLQRHSQIVFNTSTLGFISDRQRQQAIEKWREFRAGDDAAP